MNQRKSENAYNIYEAAGSFTQDSETCPFTGLPAVHLKLMCSPIVGLLTKIEKKLFFAQSKDFYAGILDKWILLYPSKSNDMKPSECFYPKSINVLKGDNHQFIVTTNNNDKRYHFQAPNSEEFYEWVVNINRIIDELTTGKMRESQIPQLLTRKLPSLPQVNKKEEAYYTFGNTPQSINNNEERLYEEPCSSSIKDEIDNSVKPQSNEEKPPELPIKTGKKNSSEKDIHDYDTPKSKKSVGENKKESHESDITEQQPEAIEESQDKSEEIIVTPQRSGKVSEMTAILSSINLVSPEEKRKSSNLIRERKSLENSINSQKDDENIITVKKDSKSPVKKWFTRRIMRGKKQQNNREITCVVEEDNEGGGGGSCGLEGEEEEITSVKGTKVNMIINQLEKSGQLKALKKGLKTRKSLVYDDNKEYEPICVKHF